MLDFASRVLCVLAQWLSVGSASNWRNSLWLVNGRNVSIFPCARVVMSASLFTSGRVTAASLDVS